jgi:parallel beta-helix repeat protein
VDAVPEGGEIRVATGVYTGVQGRPVPPGYEGDIITQVVHISKSVTIRGGYTIANWDNPDPNGNPTTLNAEGDGRVVAVMGPVTATLEGLRITGGQGPVASDRGGGGLYGWHATVSLRENHIVSNTAHSGGGLGFHNCEVVLEGNRVISNTAWGPEVEGGWGGGAEFWFSGGTLSDNVISGNMSVGSGGGIWGQDVTLEGNTISGNHTGFRGGGFSLGGNIIISSNLIYSNTAVDRGGGGALGSGVVIINGNDFLDNLSGSSGGGLDVQGATITATGNVISGNYSLMHGGGIHLYGSDGTVTGNTVTANTSDGHGGGLSLGFSPVDVSDNTVERNAGTGISVQGEATLVGNRVLSNTGGGIYGLEFTGEAFSNTVRGTTGGDAIALESSNALIQGNDVSDNAGVGVRVNWSDGTRVIGNWISGNVTATGTGGGVQVLNTVRALLEDNDIVDNQADWGGGVYAGGSVITATANRILSNTAGSWGGGICVLGDDGSTIALNQIQANRANDWGGGICVRNVASPMMVTHNDIISNTSLSGGGLYIESVRGIVLEGNTVLHNTADTGAGVYMYSTLPFTMTNNLIARNQADVSAGGLHVSGWDVFPSAGELVNNTIVQNDVGAGGEGICVPEYATLALTNNLLVSHTVGISATSSLARVTATHTLFYGNALSDTWGPGTIVSANEITGSAPLFVDPGVGDYHIHLGSPAVDAGASVPWLTDDIDGEPRFGLPDIGADECVVRLYLPLVVRNH